MDFTVLSGEKDTHTTTPVLQPAQATTTSKTRSESLRSDQAQQTDNGYLQTLLESIARKDPLAFTAFHADTAQTVSRLAMSIVNTDEDRDEVVNDVYLQVWRTADRYDASRASAIAWLCMITRSRALDKLRSVVNNRQEAVADEILQLQADPQTPTPETLLHTMQDQTRLRRNVDDLAEIPRQMILMNFYQEMSHAEIAEQLSLPLGTVKSHIFRSLRKLRENASMASTPCCTIGTFA